MPGMSGYLRGISSSSASLAGFFVNHRLVLGTALRSTTGTSRNTTALTTAGVRNRAAPAVPSASVRRKTSKSSEADIALVHFIDSRIRGVARQGGLKRRLYIHRDFSSCSRASPLGQCRDGTKRPGRGDAWEPCRGVPLPASRETFKASAIGEVKLQIPAENAIRSHPRMGLRIWRQRIELMQPPALPPWSLQRLQLRF